MDDILDFHFYGNSLNRKITDIKEIRAVTKFERDELGVAHSVTNEYIFRRRVQYTSSGLRLLHFIIDLFVVPFVLLYLLAVNQDLFPIAIREALVYFIFLGPYIIGEFFLQKTFSKFLTQSVVIDQYARKPRFFIVVLRTLIRFIPFEPFSALDDGRAWHDKWTSTFVVSEGEWKKLKSLLEDDRNFPVMTISR